MDSLLSFPVGLFHPLQHAGLARRTPDYRLFVRRRGRPDVVRRRSHVLFIIASGIVWQLAPKRGLINLFIQLRITL